LRVSRISVLTLIVCAFSLALGLTACADIAATNPFDPGAPTGQQAAGAVTGTLVRPVGHDASRFSNARVDLVGLGGLAGPASDGGAQAAASADVDPITGDFTVTDVAPGAYGVSFVVPGFRAPAIRIVIGIGETVALGEIALEIPTRTTTISGVARRAGAPDDGHGGISVEALGTPFTAATASGGAFTLAVTEGEFTLRFSLPGYTAQTVPLGRTLAAGDTFALPSEIMLVGAPGSVRGTLMLQPGFTGDLALPDAVVTLVPGDGMAGPPTQPDALGRYAFADVVAADYTLHVELGSFFPLDVPVTVPVGGAVELPPLTLFSVSDGTGEDTGFAVGTATLQGAAEGRHGGTRVQAVGTPFVALTADDGAFRLPVAAGRRYDIALSHEGYTPFTASEVLIEAGVETPLAKVTLVGEPGRVTGVVQLPERFRDRLQGVDVCLLLPDAPTSACAGGGEPLGEGLFAHVNPAADGRFLFDAVGAGTYALVAALDGFEPWRDELEVALGAETRGGRIVLVPAEPRAAVFGVARPAGGGDVGHAGTNVSAAGTPYGTQTNDDGTYLLDLPARDAGYTLRFGRPGYNEESRTLDSLPEGARVELAEVVLTGQPGRISGTVVLPSPDPLALDAATAQRFAPPGPGAVPCADDAACPAPARCVLLTCRTPEDDANVDSAGHFVFADVPAGAHTVGVRLDRFHPAAVDTVVVVGEETVVGNVGLTPLPAQAFITGLAQRAGAATHGGITVTLRGTAFQAETTPEGRFLLAVPVADLGYTLDVTLPGYGSESVQVGGLSPGETHTLPDPILLVGQPGQIRLIVELPEQFVDPDLILQASVELSRFDETDALVLVRSEPVSQNGVVVVDALAAGSYVLRITHPGFESSFRSVALEVGAQADLGIVHLSLPGDALRAQIRGTVRLRCGGPCSYGGIRVEAAGVPFVTFTNAEGRFELQVTDGSYTLLATYPGFQQTGPPAHRRGQRGTVHHARHGHRTRRRAGQRHGPPSAARGLRRRRAPAHRGGGARSGRLGRRPVVQRSVHARRHRARRLRSDGRPRRLRPAPAPHHDRPGARARSRPVGHGDARGRADHRQRPPGRCGRPPGPPRHPGRSVEHTLRDAHDGHGRLRRLRHSRRSHPAVVACGLPGAARRRRRRGTGRGAPRARHVAARCLPRGCVRPCVAAGRRPREPARRGLDGDTLRRRRSRRRHRPRRRRRPFPLHRSPRRPVSGRSLPGAAWHRVAQRAAPRRRGVLRRGLRAGPAARRRVGGRARRATSPVRAASPSCCAGPRHSRARPSSASC
jgi:hypothetical protein